MSEAKNQIAGFRLRRKRRLAVFTTHPIQYQAPWFRALAARPDLHTQVLFSYVPRPSEQGVGFGRSLTWDIPLRDGYANSVFKSLSPPFWTPPFFSRVVRGVVAQLRAFRPDTALIMGWQEFSLLQALLACQALRIPVILRGESNAKRTRPAWVSSIQRCLVACADAALAIGDSNAEFYRSLGMPNQRILMARYFVDNERFAAAANAALTHRNARRAAWGAPAEAFVLLFAGKLEPKKRVFDFLKMIHLARAQGAVVHGVVVGAGAQLDEARLRTKEMALPITFVGILNQTEIPAAYTAADALVLPSDYGETWGLVCNEAMVCGTPAIVSERVGCAGDLVVDGETGGVAPFARPDRLAAIAASWSANRVAHAAIAARARNHVMREYTIGRAVETLVAAVGLVAQ
jgi:glycosyltransferase involved in cell wall biosynthesis